MPEQKLRPSVSVSDVIHDLSLLGLEEKQFKPILKQVLIENVDGWGNEPDLHIFIVSKTLQRIEEEEKENGQDNQ